MKFRTESEPTFCLCAADIRLKEAIFKRESEQNIDLNLKFGTGTSAEVFLLKDLRHVTSNIYQLIDQRKTESSNK